jgi:hypothetical protein
VVATRAALRGFRETGNRRGEGAALNNLAMNALLAGDPDRAREWARQSLGVHSELRFAEGQLDVLRLFAAVEQADGRPAGALLLQLVEDRERDRLGTAALSREESGIRETVLAAARGELGQRGEAEVRARAERTGLDAVVAELLHDGSA